MEAEINRYQRPRIAHWLTLEDMEVAEVAGSVCSYTYPCRCGSNFVLDGQLIDRTLEADKADGITRSKSEGSQLELACEGCSEFATVSL